jgi:Uma2 family endonuclease
VAITEQAPISSRVGQRMTIEEFLKLPEEEPALELIDGIVRQKVAAKPFHGRLQSKFWERLNRALEEDDLGVAFTETRFSTGDASPVPDISVYLWDRLPLMPDGTPPMDFTIPPDIAVEIVSPDQRISDLIKKCTGFIENGVRVALLVHPDERSVFVFRPNAPPRVLRHADRIDLHDILPRFEMTAAELFGFLSLRPRARRQAAAE